MDKVQKRKVSAVVKLYALFCLHLAMQALVWLGMVWFRAIWFGTVQFSASYENLRQPHILKQQI
jgi:hypothetical protein